MLPCANCPDFDENDKAKAHELHSTCWLGAYDVAYRDSKKAEAKTLLDTHLQADYGTTDYLSVVAQWIANPTDPLLLNGDWGYAHAAISLSKLQTAKAGGASNAELEALGLEEIEHWYRWEALPRCKGVAGHPAVQEWQNPNNWYEDSRLDYYTPLLFIEWFLDNL